MCNTRRLSNLSTSAMLDGLGRAARVSHNTRVDPFAESFRLQFNDENYEPEAHDAALGITQDLLDELAEAASKHPHERNWTVFKSRWLKIRATFTTAWHAYTKSGQQNGDSFESFVGPDKISQEAQGKMYCEAAFY
jgi:hypothetical protein